LKACILGKESKHIFESRGIAVGMVSFGDNFGDNILTAKNLKNVINKKCGRGGRMVSVWEVGMEGQISSNGELKEDKYKSALVSSYNCNIRS